MQEVVFDTLEQAQGLQERDYQTYLSRIENPIAKAQTTAWADIKQRIDGKYAYFTLQDADYTGYTVEDYTEQNYQQQS